MLHPLIYTVGLVLMFGFAVEVAAEPWYHATSPWRQPIPADAAVITDAAYYVDGDPAKGLRAFAGMTLTSDTGQYTYPVHYVTSDMPQVPVSIRGVLSEVVDDDGDGDEDRTIRHRWGTASYRVHLDTSAQYKIPAGSDRQFIIINTDTGQEFGCWRAEDRDGDGFWEPWQGDSVQNGYAYNVGWLAYPPSDLSDNLKQFMNRGAGLTYAAGLVLQSEIAAGRIEHALAFAFPRTHDTDFVFPATRTDGGNIPGDGPLGQTLPEGQLIQLDPTLDVTTLGLSTAGEVIARALQEYGMICVDTSGSLKLIAEHESTARWSVLPEDQAVVRDTVSRIPVEAFRAIASPYPANQVVDIHEYASTPDPVAELRATVEAMEARVRELEAVVERVKGALEQ